MRSALNRRQLQGQDGQSDDDRYVDALLSFLGTDTGEGSRQMRTLLAGLKSSDHGVLGELLPLLAAVIQPVRFRRSIEIGMGGMRLSIEPILDDEQARQRYAFSLLIDPSRAWWDKLRVCQYTLCERFYIPAASVRGGPPNQRYCCQEHRHAANDADRTARRHRSRDAASGR